MVDGWQSKRVNVVPGVPQGSVLDPLPPVHPKQTNKQSNINDLLEKDMAVQRIAYSRNHRKGFAVMRMTPLW